MKQGLGVIGRWEKHGCSWLWHPINENQWQKFCLNDAGRQGRLSRRGVERCMGRGAEWGMLWGACTSREPWYRHRIPNIAAGRHPRALKACLQRGQWSDLCLCTDHHLCSPTKFKVKLYQYNSQNETLGTIHPIVLIQFNMLAQYGPNAISNMHLGRAGLFYNFLTRR
jgi:hypothetical protein